MFTIEALIDEVKKLATEHPDNIYIMPEETVTCMYNDGTCTDGSIGCIFGQAIKRLDPEIKIVETGIADLLKNHLKITMTDQQLLWCRMFQIKQDSRKTWSEALHESNS